MKLALFANTDWYLYNFRRSLALALRNAGHEPVLISPAGPHVPKLRELGLEWRPVSLDRGSLNPLREIAVVNELTSLLRAEQPALVHNFTIKCSIYGSIAARRANVPACVNSITGFGYVFSNRNARARLLRPVVRLLLRATIGGVGMRLVLQNPDDVLLVRSERIASDTVRLIPGSGVDCEMFRPVSTPLERPAFRVLLASRLIWEKGVGEFVSAARLLREQGRNISFLIAGDCDPGNPGSIPRETVSAWVEEGAITWLGHVNDMPALLRTVNAVALPSYYAEGLPRSLIEAGACQLPIVTTDTPGCRHVVDNEIDGLLVPAGNSRALAEAIARLHDHPEFCVRLGTAARAKAVERFSEQAVISQTWAVYRELVPELRGP